MKIFSNLKQKNSITSTISLLALASLSSLACSSSGGSSPAGLFLRPAGDANTKVYSNGQGLLLENSDGSTNEIVIGTFENDRLTPYNIKDEDDGAGDGDDISVDYSYSLATNAGDDYSNTLFSISENVLSFTGVDSGVLGETPPYKLSIETALNVKIALPATFNGYINADASNDDTDANTRKFSFSGGVISNTDVAAAGEEAAYRTIDVTEGKIYVADATKATGKIINFEALDSYRLPATEGIYEYYVIVDGTGKVSAISTLPTGTEFYVIGTTEAYEVPESITIEGIKFTDKVGGEIAEAIKVIYKSTGDVEVSVDGNTIITKVTGAHVFDDVLTALRAPANGVTALVDVTTTAGYVGSGLNGLIGNTDFGYISLSGGMDAVSGGAAAVQAQVTIGGLTIVATASKAGTEGNGVNLLPTLSGNDGSDSDSSDIAIQFLANGTMVITYDNQATLADLITAIDGNTAANALVDFVGTDGTDYDGTDLLIDVLPQLYSFAEDSNSRTLRTGTDPIANGTGEAQTGAHTWTDEARLGTEDYIINLSPQ